MNRRTRTLLPTTGSLLEPRTLSSSHEREKLKDVQKRQARYYNSDAHDLPELNEGDNLRLKPFVLGKRNGRREWLLNDLTKGHMKLRQQMDLPIGATEPI